MAWCFSTRASVATVLTTHPCVSRCLRVNQDLEKACLTFEISTLPVDDQAPSRVPHTHGYGTSTTRIPPYPSMGNRILSPHMYVDVLALDIARSSATLVYCVK